MSEPRQIFTVDHRSLALQTWQVPTQQAAFRQLLEAFSYPGRRVELNTDGDAWYWCWRHCSMAASRWPTLKGW